MIHILATGPLNTVQDLGRLGYRNIGVTVSGAMDPLALRVGNILVGNAEDAAGIEIQTFPFRIEFEEARVFALTGADCVARLGGRELPPWWSMRAEKGQVLELATPMKHARAYLCFRGGVDVPPVMGSRSTSLRGAFGGYGGRALATGDTLALAQVEHAAFPANGLGVLPPAEAMTDAFPTFPDGELLLRAIPAGEHDLFGSDAERFWSQPWKITSQSDRTGYRLAGTPIQLSAPVELRSYGIIPGIVQVPPGGEPIIQMSEANTAGGYPKIAGIVDGDLWRLGQARIGSRIRFVQAGVREALEIERSIEAYLADIRKTFPLVLSALDAMTRR
ncbi:biotin-dependent carboxyltransferase family protein [Rhizobium puerariae]|uniref:Biotin-dependent carboxyltransferase family protein n=1 Tax=Rhizobium puerariae TaxID=1585791 RepID=A0ABV6AEN7_9HYPH